MPNDCWSVVTIKSTKGEDIDNIYNNYLKRFTTIHKNEYALKVRIWTAWRPDIEMLNEIKNKYPNIWLKNEWNEEGGKHGIWIYNDCWDLEDKKVKEFTWNDMCIEEYGHSFPSH